MGTKATHPEKTNTAADTASISQKCESALELLIASKRPVGPQLEQDEAQPFDPCSPPAKTPPQFVIKYRRPLPLISLLIPGDVDHPVGPIPDFFLGCVKVEGPPAPKGLAFHLGLDFAFEQVWNLTKLALGDLSSTLSLAPLEQLTLEFQTSQRRVFEQSAIDSAEEMTSTESTTSDKEAINVARSSSKTENWHVDGNGGFDLGIVKLGAGAGGGGTTTDTAQDSIQHISEATQKSAHSLKSLHKIEVRGVSESLIQNRMTRVIKNPYADRALSLNVFQLIKHFSVMTRLTEIRVALIAEVNGLVFDQDFVLTQVDFLRDKLIDQSLLDDLPIAIQGAKPIFSSGGEVAAQHVAKLALRYLFDEPNLFGMPSPLTLAGNVNDPENSFNAAAADGTLAHSGLARALADGLGDIFTTLNMFFKIYREMRDTVVPATMPSLLEQEDNAIWLAVGLAAQVGDKWTAFLGNTANQGAAVATLNQFELTEIFRRLSGFVAIVKDRLLGLAVAAAEDQKAVLAQAEAVFALNRLIQHLNCNQHYYTQQFLVYIAKKTDSQTIVDFVNQLIDSTKRVSAMLPDQLRRIFDAERAFVSRQVVIIPGIRPLTEPELIPVIRFLSGDGAAEFAFDDITPSVANIEVPCDGIHLEVGPGLCILHDVPAQATTIDLAVHDASLKITAP